MKTLLKQIFKAIQNIIKYKKQNNTPLQIPTYSKGDKVITQINALQFVATIIKSNEDSSIDILTENNIRHNTIYHLYHPKASKNKFFL